MASSTPASEAVAASVSKLTIDPSKKPASGKAQKSKPKKVVVDSWEDEDVSSGSEEGGGVGGDSRLSTSGHDAKAGTAAPPPTPVSPNYNTSSQAFTPMMAALSPTSADGGHQSRRPEKTDAVARRMIASALGVKAPKPTEEQKAYDRAMRENERKRREEDRAMDKKKQEEADEAKRAIWED